MARKKYITPEPDIERWRFMPLREYLTIEELRQLYMMYNADCSIQTICLYMRIKHRYALECIEAAEWLYGGGLAKLQKRNRQLGVNNHIWTENQRGKPIINNERKPGRPKIQRIEPEPYTRPPAIYTNQSEWQRFVNTGS